MSDDPDSEDNEPDGGGDGEDDADNPFEVIEEPESTNPFDQIDTEDREADPFEQIGTSEAQSSETTDTNADPFDEIGPSEAADTQSETDAKSEETATPAVPATGDDADDPFAGLSRDERDGDPFEGLSKESVESGESTQPDADMWEDLSKEDVEPETESHGQRRFAEVSKHTYCERCEYFSKPPEIACSHDGTDIIEFTDFETVRVADCPIVAEREELADIERER